MESIERTINPDARLSLSGGVWARLRAFILVQGNGDFLASMEPLSVFPEMSYLTPLKAI